MLDKGAPWHPPNCSGRVAVHRPGFWSKSVPTAPKNYLSPKCSSCQAAGHQKRPNVIPPSDRVAKLPVMNGALSHPQVPGWAVPDIIHDEKEVVHPQSEHVQTNTFHPHVLYFQRLFIAMCGR